MDINVKDHNSGGTPLHVAAAKTHWSVLECLVGWGAALNTVDGEGDTPLLIVTVRRSCVIPESPQLNQVSIYYFFCITLLDTDTF